MNNQKIAYNVFSKDGECVEDTHTEKGYITKLKLKDVVFAKDVFCGKCGHKSVYTTSEECNIIPNLNYYCYRCKIAFIFVFEYKEVLK